MSHVLAECMWLVVMVVGRCFVVAINAFLDWWAVHYQLHANLKGTSKLGGHQASDGVSPPGRGVEFTLWAARYGPHPKETLDTALCEDRALAHEHPAVLYVHGGGWIAANSCALLHSVAPLARAGFDVYSCDYQLAPAAKFPDPIVSVLRALQWMRVHEGIEEVLLLGDSAGGNLVTMAASFVSNPALLAQLGEVAGVDFGDAWVPRFPRIVAVSTVYAIMDASAWDRPLAPHTGWLENRVTRFCVEFAFRCYRCPDGRFGNRLTLMDVLDDVHVLPPLQMHCGTKDVLVHSNRLAYERLSARNLSVELHEHDARHCYFGFPPAWLPDDHTATRDTLQAILAFFSRHAAKQQQQQQHPPHPPQPFRRNAVRSLGATPHKPNPHPNRWYFTAEQDDVDEHERRFKKVAKL